MEITTIKLQRKTKQALDTFKGKRESYDRAIQKLVTAVQEKGLKKQLIAAYQQMGQDELDILHEWDPASAEVDNEQH